MSISLNGMDFDVDVMGFLKDRDLPAQIKTVAEARDQQVYFWVCTPPGQGRFMPPAKAPGKVPLRSMVVFAEGTGGAFRPVLDRGASRSMMRDYLSKTTARNVSDIVRAFHALVRIPVVDIPLNAFAWMNPHATYVINHEIVFVVLQLTNAKSNLRLTALLPHRSVFTAEILDECQPDAMAELERGGKNPDEEVVFMHKGASKRVDEWRRAAIRTELRVTYKPAPGLMLAGSTLDNYRRLEDELKRLTP